MLHATHQPLYHKRAGTTSSYRPVSARLFSLVRASDMMGIPTAQRVYIIIIMLPYTLIHVAIGCTMGLLGFLFFFFHQDFSSSPYNQSFANLAAARMEPASGPCDQINVVYDDDSD